MPTILLVEDETLLADTLRYNLEREGYTVIYAADGVTGLDLARAEQPDLLILDVMLPKLDGFSVCRILRRETNIPIMMLTARQAPEDLAVALEAGADDFLSKPFNRVELMARLHAGMRIINLHRALTDRIQELEESRLREHHLRSLMPICSYCKKIRGDKDDWEPIDQYLAEHGYRFTHAVCPSCLETVARPTARPVDR